MRGRSARESRRGLLLAGALLSGMSGRAAAQDATTLEELSVTSVSPIQARGAGRGSERFPAGVLPVVTDTFSPVTVLTQSEIQRNQPTQLGDALFEKPGISASTFAPGAASRPIIRGLDNTRVRVQENGITIGDVSELSEDHAIPINPLITNRIEVVRGPAALRYGSQAIGGVVSAENNRVPTFIPVSGVAGQITTGYSSVDNGFNTAATVDAGADNIAVHADGFRSRADSYDTPDGIQANSQSRSQGGAVGISAIGDRGFVGISYSRYEALYGIPGGGSAERRVLLDPVQDRVLARGEYRPLEGPIEAVRFWAGGSVYKHNESGLEDDGLRSIGSTFKSREAEGRLELQHVPVTLPFGVLTGALGFQSSRRVLAGSGEAGGLVAPTDGRSTAAYLFEEIALPTGTRLQAAGRIEGARVTGTAVEFGPTFLPGDEAPAEFGRRRHFAPKSASFGILQELPADFVLSLTGQYVERAPAALELYSRGPHEATETFEIGDPNLKLERARTVEVGIRRAVGPFRLEATGYVTRYTGFIYKRDTGVRCGDDFASCGADDELRQIVYTQQNANFHGAEIGAQYDAIPIGDGFIGVDGQFDFVRATFDDGTNVPRIPPYRIGGGLYLRADGWFARVGLLHAFGQDRFAPFESFTPGYDLLKAEISRTAVFDPVVTGFREITFGLVGNNLLDDRVRNSASFKVDEILLPGRNVRLFLTARF